MIFIIQVLFDGVKQCVAVGVSNTHSAGDHPHVFIVPTKGTIFDQDKISQLITFVNERVADKTMKLDANGVTLLKELPDSKNYKLDRKKLRQMANNEIHE